MTWNIKIARKKAKATLQIALTIAFIFCLNGFIEYLKVLPESRTMVFYGKPLEIPTAQAKEVEVIPEKPEEKPAKKVPASREKIDAIIKKEFPKDEVPQARRVIWCESRYNPGVHNQNPATGDDSVGLGQINLAGNLFPGRLLRAQSIGYQGKPTREALIEWLKIPENNIRYFASMQSKSGWSPWSCDRMVKDPNWKYRAQMLAFLEG